MILRTVTIKTRVFKSSVSESGNLDIKLKTKRSQTKNISFFLIFLFVSSFASGKLQSMTIFRRQRFGKQHFISSFFRTRTWSRGQISHPKEIPSPKDYLGRGRDYLLLQGEVTQQTQRELQEEQIPHP